MEIRNELDGDIRVDLISKGFGFDNFVVGTKDLKEKETFITEFPVDIIAISNIPK